MADRQRTTVEGDALVGREHELRLLTDRLVAAAEGTGRLVLVSGEPGIGKTRLAQALARRASETAFEVAWGRCRETEGAPAFWPWMQVLRTVLAGTAVPAASRLRLLVEPTARAPAGTDRFALFESVSAVLTERAREHPLLVLLDDLHRADRPSLRLLEFLAPEIADVPLVVVGTYRDTEIAPGVELLRLVADSAELLPVRGLTVDACAELVGDRGPGARRRVEELHRRTAGNPFFLGELLRRPAHDATVPVTVQAALATRLGRLPDATRELLGPAAVLGREFPSDLLSALTQVDPDELTTRLQAAVTAGLLRPTSSTADAYCFAHVLVRDALYEELPPALRADLHDRVVRLLATGADASDHALEEQAVHAARTLRTPGERRRAVHLLEQAGTAARDRLAHEEAAAWFDRACALSQAGAAERFRLLLSFGACAVRAAQTDRARDALREAWDLAVAQGWEDRLAEVALTLGEGVDSAGSVDADLVRMLEQALARAAPADRLGRIRLSARLATEIYWTARLPEARRLAADAVAAARRLGDRRALVVALGAQQFALRGPDQIEERVRLGNELVREARDLGDAALELQGRRLLLADALQIGREAAEAELSALDALARATRRPLARWYVMVNQCVLAGLDGESQALALVQETAAFGRRIGAEPAEMYAVVQRFALLRRLGRGAECERALRQAVARYPRLATLRCALALLLAEHGRAEEAVALLEQLTEDGCTGVPPDALWLASVSLLVLAAARVGRPAELAVLERLLSAHQHKLVVQGLAVWWGAVDHYLGVARAALGRLDEAEHSFQAALRVHRKWRAESLARESLQGLSEVRERRRAGERAVEGDLMTARERQVLGMLQEGAANKQIARELGISVRTVERHVTNLYGKIGARSRSQATRLGLLMDSRR